MHARASLLERVSISTACTVSAVAASAGAALLAALLAPATANACTNILAAKGATADGSTLISYVADSHELYGDLVMRAAGTHVPDATLEIYEWDTGKHLGQIKEAPKTYAVVGNMNEKQVAIGETTFGGREELVDTTAVVDYGSLMYIALQRAASAREAIKVMTDLVAQYGYASEGETFSISDPNEVWLMEMVGKGSGNTGALWVARRVPDGMISAHANQSRIRQFPLNDRNETLYAKDVISFARAKGWFSGKDEEFSFADAYAPADYETLRACEARVWSVFRRAAPSLKLSSDFVSGVPGAKPLPLWVKPDKKLSPHDMMQLLRDHFEGTDFDLSKDVGAGPFHLPYRWRPMSWEYDGKTYLNERAISTQQTGFSFVAQARAALPDPVGGILWFGVDDTYSTVYVPMYAGITVAPRNFATGVATLHRFSWDSAFWVFNVVANFAYSRYEDMIKDIQIVQRELEGEFVARQPEVDQAAVALYRQSPELARDYLTRTSAAYAEKTIGRWRALAEALMVKYMDGNVKDELGAVTHPPYPQDWYKRIAQETGDHFLVKKLAGAPEKDESIAVAGYFHSREELGELAAAVPADFPFASEKLVLLPGSDKCKRPPKCCVSAALDSGKSKLVFTLPKDDGDKCGSLSWLIRMPKQASVPLVEAKNEP